MDRTSMLEHDADHSERVTPAMRVTIDQFFCESRGVPVTIESLAQQIARQESGHVTIPEDLQYRHASRVVAVGKELTSLLRRMLEIYTGHDESKLVALRNESAEAVCEASVALYGRPFDLVSLLRVLTSRS